MPHLTFNEKLEQIDDPFNYTIDYLKERGYEIINGIIILPNDREETRDETDAINYLFWEWDFIALYEDDPGVINAKKLQENK